MKKSRKKISASGAKKPSNVHKRGFASMDEKRKRHIAAMGGKMTAKRHGGKFYKTIGRRGGLKTAQTHNSEFYKEIGILGGEARKKMLGQKGYKSLGQKGGSAHWSKKSSR